MPSLKWSTISLLLGSFSLTANAVQTISAVGSKFFYEDGTQYFLKGIAYQLIPEDPLIDVAQCKRDAALMGELGANSIRVYHVDPKANHDGCMKAFADKGIYLFLDLDTFDTAIDQTTPKWTEQQSNAFKAVMDAFHHYDNLAGFFVGNEVLTTKEGSPAAPYVLAAVRDMKSYRNEKHYRNIPIGYSAADIAELRPMLQNYLSCRDDAAERVDFFALNAYEWCGDANYKESGYVNLQAQAKDYPVPIFFSETGCNVARPRLFTDQHAIFSKPMVDTWSGSIVYEWIQETNDYGLISYGPEEPNAPATKTNVQDGFVRSGKPTPIQPDFDNLKGQWATLSPKGVPLDDYVKSTGLIKPPACPAPTGGWLVNADEPLPTLGEEFHRPAETGISHGHSKEESDNDDESAGSSSSSSSSSSGSNGDGGSTSHGPSSSDASSTDFQLSNGAGSLATRPFDGAMSLAVLVCSAVGGLALWL
ncbi:Glucanosyltransferase-domain-containing protein [Aspergillus taichungensis]|uniref:1,3-beta-glucanosyltransferase n=1 Tax=Aspergillus taichungensis TaxID=482145 RepID=A0A2J5I6Z2_9EURO|nr:Glucanosyltransferase-domain-containing protein [Aspergillus taichungensis]